MGLLCSSCGCLHFIAVCTSSVILESFTLTVQECYALLTHLSFLLIIPLPLHILINFFCLSHRLGWIQQIKDHDARPTATTLLITAPLLTPPTPTKSSPPAPSPAQQPSSMVSMSALSGMAVAPPKSLSSTWRSHRWYISSSRIPLMRPHIAYTHNEPCATLCDTFATIWGDSRSRTTKDDKGRHTLRPFAMSYTILQYSTVFPFTFTTFSNLFWHF